MESNKNDIDNFFKESLSGLGYSDSKGNWELMNHLLDESRRKKKRKRLIILFLLAGMIVSSGLIYVMMNHDAGETRHYNQPDSAEKLNENNTAVKEITSSPSNEVQKQTAQQLKTNDDLLSRDGEHNNETAFNDNRLTAGQGNNSAAAKTIQTSDIAVDLIVSAEAPPAEEKNLQQEYQRETEVKTIGDENAFRDSSVDLTKQTAIAGDSSMNPDSTEMQTGDSVVTAPDAGQERYRTKNPKSPYEFILYAGANAYESGYGSIHFSPIAGLGFRTLLVQDFRIELAGFYALQGGYDLNDTETAVTETYFLDKEVNVTTASINIRKQHKIYVPLTFYYSLSEKHSILAALQLSFLVNTEGNYSEKNTVSGITSETTKKNVKGYADGIRTTNYSLSLGYQYSLSKKFDLQARVTRDLADTYDENYFPGVDTGPLWSFQAFLIFHF